jgi:hypothetical protein
MILFAILVCTLTIAAGAAAAKMGL